MTPQPHSQHTRLGFDTAALAAISLQVTELRHDLRACVGQVLGFSELLLEDAQEKGRPEMLAPLQEVQQIASRMLAQTNEQLVATGPSDAEHLPLVQESLCQQASRIVTLAHDLGAKLATAAPLFRSDLDRVAGAALRAAELARTAPIFSKGPRPLLFPRQLAPAAAAAGSSHLDTATVAVARKEGSILVVDDLEENRELLHRRLTRLGYNVQLVENGLRALEVVGQHAPDLVLLDILMPGLNGIEVLQSLKQNAATREIPVVMLSSADEVDTVVRCISMGADDFLPKPFNPTLLMARIDSSLSKKRLRDQEAAFLKRLQAEQAISERLLLNILPKPIAARLKQGESSIGDSFPDVTVLFSDFVGFTRLAAGMPPKLLVDRLNDIYSRFDQLCERLGLEKIKMIGDAYMAVGGLPEPRADHALAVAELALDMQREVEQFAAETRWPLQMRVGLNSGPVVAGVIGMKKFAYDLWGDTVNLASRMQAHAKPGAILVTTSTRDKIKDHYQFKPARLLPVKGRGQVLAYALVGKR